MADEGLQLRDGDHGPRLVTVVNSSRIESDINRDTKHLQGTYKQLSISLQLYFLYRSKEQGTDNDDSNTSCKGSWQAYFTTEVTGWEIVKLCPCSGDVC